MRRSFLFFLFLLLWSTNSFAQNGNYYVIVVGNFMNAKAQDFEPIRPLGFVHSAKMNENLYQIYLGGYTQRSDAEEVLPQLKKMGYSNAYIQERLPSEGRTVTVIQIATRSTAKPIPWERFLEVGTLYAILKEDNIKITTGLYSSIDAAKADLGDIRKSGYSDAFIKKVNSIYLHEVTEFATGVKKALIPLSLDESSAPPARTNQRPKSYDQQSNIPSNFDQVTARSAAPLTPTPTSFTPKSFYPDIRSRVKRKSVLDLQKTLKAEGDYTSTLDGLYGPGTQSAYESFVGSSREYQKFKYLAQSMNFDGGAGVNDKLQSAINNLLTEPSAPNTIEQYSNPIAMGYRAYLLFTNLGPSSEVNSLMNEAIDKAYQGKKVGTQLPFDYRATYAYEDLDQLILHLHYLHSAPGSQYAAPCWLFQKHPNETTRAYETYARFSSENFKLQACDQFMTWEEVRTMQAIAIDMNPSDRFNAAKLSEAASRRAKLFVSPEVPDAEGQKALLEWDRRLWNGLNGWGARDPLHKKTITAFSVAYHQSQILLEDYFMDQGFKTEEAKSLALETLFTLVGYHLERFV